jgi:excisionase family DNA binding protein
VHTSQTRKYVPERVKAPGNMLRTGEACRILCIHSNTLRRWSEQGIVKTYRVGPRGDRRFRREDIAALLIEKTEDSRADRIKLSHQ